MVRANLFGRIRAHIMVTFSRTTFMDKVNINGLMVGYTMASGLTTKWRVKELSLGQMVESMKVTIKMTRNMDMVPSNGLTEESILVNGAKANNTAKASISKRVRRDKEFGKWVRGLNGSKTIMQHPQLKTID